MSEATGTGLGDGEAPGPPGVHGERRWPMATAVLVATLLFVVTPTAGASPDGGWDRCCNWCCSGS